MSNGGNGNLDILLKDLATIRSVESVSYNDRNKIQNLLKSTSSMDYLDHIFVSKPEEALTDCLFRPLMKSLEVRLTPQATTSEGWVDFLITNSYGNPVAVEIKPLHAVRHTQSQKHIVKLGIDVHLSALQKDLETRHQNQIVNYLKSYDYVVLTNLDEVCYFNREAIVDFKPFLREKIDDLIIDLNSIKGFWEVVRRKEDRTPKMQLDKLFFSDLRRWYERFDQVEWLVDEQTQREMKIVLLNKFIFAQTLEDFGLIPFRFLRESYEDAKKRWTVKGPEKVLQQFFRDFDDWFYSYYDTELFKADVLACLVKTGENLRAFAEAVESILGFGKWDQALSKGLVYYNYRYIDEDVLGKSYEMFLAENRKEQGIYYTPKDITSYMAHRLVEELFGPLKTELSTALGEFDVERAEQSAERLASVSILDPACGSGSFLVKVLREIYQVYDTIERETAWADRIWLTDSQDMQARAVVVKRIRESLGIGLGNSNKRRLISLIIQRHLHGVDLDKRALDVAKVNVWKEAVKLCPDAFRYSTLQQDTSHILPDLELNFIHANTIISPDDNGVVDVLQRHYRSELQELWKLRTAHLKDPFESTLLEQLLSLRQKLRESVLKGIEVPSDRPFIGPVDLFWLYFDEDGEPLETMGCDGIIGNPPWESIKPFGKEFAAAHPEVFGSVSKHSVSGPDFEAILKEKLKDPAVAALWADYVGGIHTLVEYVRKRYRLLGGGDPSLQKVFLERALEISRGSVMLLLPSNFHTDDGTRALRDEVLRKYRLQELLSFENRGQIWFEDVHPQFKFDIVHLTKKKPAKAFKARFYIHDISEIAGAFDYPIEDIEAFSPFTGGITEFRGSGAERKIARKIRADHPLLRAYGYRILREFHMTDDSWLFRTDGVGLPLFEGKMIEQYDSSLRGPTYYIPEAAGRSELLRKELFRVKAWLKSEGKKRGLRGKRLDAFVTELLDDVSNKLVDGRAKLDYEHWRVAYRDVASSTNQRTLISALIPPGVFLGNTLYYLKVFGYNVTSDGSIIQSIIFPSLDAVCLVALLNSFVLNYYIRLRVSAHVSAFFAYELPIPQIDDELKTSIVTLALAQMTDSPLKSNLASELGLMLPDGEFDRRELRAKLEVLIAKHVYGLLVDDMKYILGTFTFGKPDTALMADIVQRM